MTARRGFLVHDSHEERENSIREHLRKEGMLPVAAVSCRDGVLLVGARTNASISKIYRLLDRVGFIGVGESQDFRQLYQSMAARAKSLAIISMSKGDMRVVDRVVETYQRAMRDLFRDLRMSMYLQCEAIVAQVGHIPSEDRVWTLDLTGAVSTMDDHGHMVLPAPHTDEDQADMKLAFPEDRSMKDALRVFAQAVERMYGAKSRTPVTYEVAFLQRDKVHAKEYSSVYRKLDSQETGESIHP